MQTTIVNASIAVAYAITGGLLWNRWIKELPKTDSLYLAEHGEVFSRQMQWALWSVCGFFVMLWPLFVVSRFVFRKIRHESAAEPEKYLNLTAREISKPK